MATLGTTTLGGGTDSNGTGTVVINGWFQTGAGGPMVDGQAYLKSLLGSASRSQACRLVIYLDNGSNAPSTTLIGVTDEVIVDQTLAPPLWIQFPAWTHFGGAPTLASSTKYWVGMWFGTVVNSGGFQNDVTVAGGAATSNFQTGVTYSTTANPVVASWTGTGNANVNALYFDYTPGAAGPHASLPFQGQGRNL